jgi:hypothetical protein
MPSTRHTCESDGWVASCGHAARPRGAALKEDSDRRSTVEPLYLKWAVEPRNGGDVRDQVDESGGGCMTKTTSVNAMLRQSERYPLKKGSNCESWGAGTWLQEQE